MIVTALCLLTLSGAVQAQNFIVRDIGTGRPGSQFAGAIGINESGQVAGFSEVPAGEWEYTRHAFLWGPDGGLIELGTLGGVESEPFAINNLGQVVGRAQNEAGTFHPFLWDPAGGMQDLGLLPIPDRYPRTSGCAYDINDSGQVVGDDDPGQPHAFLWDANNGMIDLGDSVPCMRYDLGGCSMAHRINESGVVLVASCRCGNFLWDPDRGIIDLPVDGAADLNESGQVAGTILTWRTIEMGAPDDGFGERISRAVLWDPNQGVIDLGTPDHPSYPVAINNSGQVVGAYYTAYDQWHAFLWDPTNGYIDLGHLGGGRSWAHAINESGQVVGNSSTANGQLHAFLWDPTDGMIDLGTLGGSESEALALNNSGQVAGCATDADGRYHACVWMLINTPVSPDVPVTVTPSVDTTVTFQGVTESGYTTVTRSDTAPTLPEGFSLDDIPAYYDIETTATFTPPVTVCLAYDPGQVANPENLRLLHYENGAWVDITTSNANGVICGQANSLSPFAIATRTALPVAIDIKPGSFPNTINLGSRGLIPVAVLSSSTFEAATVDPATVRMSGAGVAIRGKAGWYMASLTDVNADGLLDQLMHVETENLDPGSIQSGRAWLTGKTFGGLMFQGSDGVTIVPPQ